MKDGINRPVPWEMIHKKEPYNAFACVYLSLLRSPFEQSNKKCFNVDVLKLRISLDLLDLSVPKKKQKITEVMAAKIISMIDIGLWRKNRE